MAPPETTSPLPIKTEWSLTCEEPVTQWKNCNKVDFIIISNLKVRHNLTYSTFRATLLALNKVT